MQYSYLQTRALQYGVDGNWITYKKSKQPVWEFLNTQFLKEVFIQIVAYSGDNPQPFWITSAQLIAVPNAINLMVAEALGQDIEDGTFTPVTDVPDYQIGYVQYHDAQRMGYQIKISQNTLFVDQSGQLPSTRRVPPAYLLADLPDLEMAHPRWVTNMALIDKTCLVFVNGFLHQTSLNPESDQSIFVVDGGITVKTSGYQRVSVLDFSKVGNLQKFPLSTLTLAPNELSGDYLGLVSVSGVPIDLSESQIMLSLGGYLILPDSVSFFRDTAHSFKIDLRDYQVNHKIVEASYYMDLTSLGLAALIPDGVQMDDSILYSNAVLEAFLKLPQSFLIVVPKTDIEYFGSTFRRYSDNRSIRTNFEPTALLFSSTGKLINYWNMPGHEGEEAFNRVQFTDFMSENEQGVTTSTVYPILAKTYPDLVPAPNDVLNQFFSLGFYTP